MQPLIARVVAAAEGGGGAIITRRRRGAPPGPSEGGASPDAGAEGPEQRLLALPVMRRRPSGQSQ